MSDLPHDDPLNIAFDPPRGLGWNTLVFFGYFYAIGFMDGLRNILFWLPSRMDLLMAFAMPLCLGTWALEDARQRKLRISLLSQPWFFLLAVPVVSGYVIWSRGWRGLGWVALHAVGWLVLATITMLVGGTVLFGAEWWRALAAR